MIITIKSSNTNLSWVLTKNPNSPPLGREIRRGFALGWFTDPQTYILSFFECIRSTGNVSWGRNPDADFHMLYGADMCDPVCGIALLNEYFRDLVNKDTKEEDIESKNEITIVSLRTNNFARKIQKYLPINIEILEESPHYSNYQIIKFSNEGTTRDLITSVLLYLLFLAFDDDRSIDISKELIQRYISFINRQNIPYYPRSLFKLRMGIDKAEMIKQLNTPEIELCLYDTHRARIEFVAEHIKDDTTVLDAGCGEFRFGKRLAKKLKKYIGVDKDEKVLNLAIDKAQKNHVDNVEFYSNLDDVIEDEIDTVICSEVIEHQDNIKQAQNLINQIINKFAPNQIIITTPNQEFNVNYMFEEGDMRHDDHKFELTGKQFDDFMNKFKGYTYQYYQVGDKVSNISCSHGGILKKNNF